MQDLQRIKNAASKSQKLLDDLKIKIRQFASQNEQILGLDQKKILKLFGYQKWSDFMHWIDEKLAQSNDAEQSKLSEISQQEAQFQQSIQQAPQRNQTFTEQDKSESELLAIQNAKLRKQNMNLQKKIQQISSFSSSSMKKSHLKR